MSAASPTPGDATPSGGGGGDAPTAAPHDPAARELGGAAHAAGAPTTPDEALAERRARAAHWEAEAARAASRVRALGNARLALFVVGGLASLWLIKTHVALWPLLGLPVAGFAALVIAHHRADAVATRAEGRRAAAAFRLARREARWDALPAPEQAEDLSDTHLFAHDLDLDGPASLLGLLGAPLQPLQRPSALLRWLTQAPDLDEARARQAAARELAAHDALLEEAAALPAGEVDLRAPKEPPGNELLAWLAQPPSPPAAWEWALGAVLAPAGVYAVIQWAVLGGGAGLLGLVAVVDAFVDQLAAKRRRATLAAADLAMARLARVRGLLRLLREHPARSDALRALQATLRADEHDADTALAQLERRLESLKTGRHNPFAFLIGFVLRAELPQRRALESWRARWAAHAPAWIAGADAFEGLLALASFRRDHPEDCEPELLSGPARFAATGLAHPLLAPDVAVRNDVALGEPARLLVISGSNMSGKSTLLRALGCNLMLAFAGATVRARSLSTSALQLGASLRARDSLLDGRSRFFAEIEGLRRIEEASGREPPVLALLDELLAGTNSSDRQAGARTLLEHLRARGALVVLTTHDLALTALAEEAGEAALNVHFRDELHEGRPHFDHRLRPGVVPRGNGLELMRSLGLPV